MIVCIRDQLRFFTCISSMLARVAYDHAWHRFNTLHAYALQVRMDLSERHTFQH